MRKSVRLAKVPNQQKNRSLPQSRYLKLAKKFLRSTSKNAKPVANQNFNIVGRAAKLCRVEFSAIHRIKSALPGALAGICDETFFYLMYLDRIKKPICFNKLLHTFKDFKNRG